MNDTPSLFVPENSLEPIPLPDAELGFMRGFYDKARADELLDRLIHDVAWRQETIILYGKPCLQPRLTAWYGDPHARYRYSGMTLEPLPWTADLLRVRDDVEAATGCRFNSVLLNYYRNERDSLSWHSDDEKEFGDRPAIASVSLGETRIFRLRHRQRKERKAVTLPLTHGSLLLMAGTTQTYWEHAIDKGTRPLGPRINLTFRLIRH